MDSGAVSEPGMRATVRGGLAAALLLAACSGQARPSTPPSPVATPDARASGPSADARVAVAAVDATPAVVDDEPPAPPPPRLTTFAAPSGATETCHFLMPFPVLPPDIDPAHLPRTWYRRGDVEDVEALCTLDLYGVGGADPEHGMCPKLHNNTPALEFFEVAEAKLDRASYEAKKCQNYKRREKKVAKLKVAVYWREAEAGLLYFHFSRLLGNLANVPTVATRTVSRQFVAQTAGKALATLAARHAETTKGGWQVLQSRHRKAAGDEVVLGSLAENPRGETNHGALAHTPGGGAFISSPEGYYGHRYYQVVTSSKPIAELIDLPAAKPAVYRKNVQLLAYALDFAHMTILDHLFNQRDRPGNIAGRPYVHYVDAGGELVWSKDVKPGEVGAAPSIELTRLMLKDNDDALLWTKWRKLNFTKFIGLIRHLDQLTYDRMQWLAAAMSSGPDQDAIRAYFLDDVGVSAQIYDEVRDRFVKLAASYKAAVAAGKLRLDLDLGAAIAGLPAGTTATK
jgi:hypothetical protein